MRTILITSAILFATSVPALSQDRVQVQVQISREIASAYVQQVNLAELRAAQAVAFLSGILFTSPEVYESVLNAPATKAYVRQPGFEVCATNLEILAQSLTKAMLKFLLSTDRKVFEDWLRSQGLERWSRQSAKEFELLVSLAREIADEAKLAQLYALDKDDDPKAVQIFGQREAINNVARVGLASNRDLDLFIVAAAARQTWQKAYGMRADLAYVLTSQVCP